jgi:hypothetical protein
MYLNSNELMIKLICLTIEEFQEVNSIIISGVQYRLHYKILIFVHKTSHMFINKSYRDIKTYQINCLNLNNLLEPRNNLYRHPAINHIAKVLVRFLLHLLLNPKK